MTTIFEGGIFQWFPIKEYIRTHISRALSLINTLLQQGGSAHRSVSNRFSGFWSVGRLQHEETAKAVPAAH